jgi:hypothetical protein
MSYRTKILAAALLSLAALFAFAPTDFANAADLPPTADLPTYKVKAKSTPDIPFFLVIDDRVSFSYIFTGTDPGMYSAKPGGGFNGTTAKSVYSFTHFDAWAYGTNVFDISMYKSDHNDPASPCTNAGGFQSGAPGSGGHAGPVTPANCAGETEVYGLVRSTYGWNDIFGTKAFAMGPLHNISFEIGGDASSANTYLAPSKRDVVAGLQFAFDLPYKGYFNVAPLVYKEIGHAAFDQCGTSFVGRTPGVTCLVDGNINYRTTWAVEMNYYMDLGFLPPEMQYFAISGRAGVYGPKGSALPASSGVGVFSTETKTEINSEPIRLTFDAGKAIWGPKYSQFVSTWIAYRYRENKFGLDHNAMYGVCTLLVGGVVTSTNSCSERSAYAGVTVKF